VGKKRLHCQERKRERRRSQRNKYPSTELYHAAARADARAATFRDLRRCLDSLDGCHKVPFSNEAASSSPRVELRKGKSKEELWQSLCGGTSIERCAACRRSSAQEGPTMTTPVPSSTRSEDACSFRGWFAGWFTGQQRSPNPMPLTHQPLVVIQPKLLQQNKSSQTLRYQTLCLDKQGSCCETLHQEFGSPDKYACKINN